MEPRQRSVLVALVLAVLATLGAAAPAPAALTVAHHHHACGSTDGLSPSHHQGVDRGAVPASKPPRADGCAILASTVPTGTLAVVDRRGGEDEPLPPGRWPHVTPRPA